MVAIRFAWLRRARDLHGTRWWRSASPGCAALAISTRPDGGDPLRPAAPRSRSPLGDDGGVPDEPTGSAEAATETEAGPAPQSPPRRLRLLLTVAAVVLTLDIVTKVLAVRLLP